MLPRTIRSRYLVPDGHMATLASRVAASLTSNGLRRRPGASMDLKTEIELSMLEKRFFPAGNTLLAGEEPIRPNCAILPVVSDVNLPETLQRVEPLWKARVGLGFSLDGLSEPLSALEELSKKNAMIDLGHRPQRGNMATLSISHPRIEEFIAAKLQGETCGVRRTVGMPLYNFNTSVLIRDSDIRENRDGVLAVLRKISAAVWDGGDPGVVFIDRITSQLPYNYSETAELLGGINTLVPCGEQAMHPNETCTLGSVNLASSSFWNGKGVNGFDRHKFVDTVALGVWCLDLAQKQMDFAGDPLLEEVSRRTRRIGLGIMGWSDAVHTQELSRSEQKEFSQVLGSLFKTTAHKTSERIAREDKTCGLFGKNQRAHLTVTCVPPTGGISLLAGNSGFALDPMPHELDRTSPAEQLELLGWWQPFFDNAISKTISVPETASELDVFEIFRSALEGTVKTLTVYRSGSRTSQPLETTSSVVRCPRC